MTVLFLPATTMLYAVLLATFALGRAVPGSVTEQFGLKPYRGDVSGESSRILVVIIYGSGAMNAQCLGSHLPQLLNLGRLVVLVLLDCFLACHVDVTSSIPAPWMEDGVNFYTRISKNCEYQVGRFFSFLFIYHLRE
jgi:hypothetical protein